MSAEPPPPNEPPYKACPWCEGTGLAELVNHPGVRVLCRACQGRGRIAVEEVQG